MPTLNPTPTPDFFSRFPQRYPRSTQVLRYLGIAAMVVLFVALLFVL